MGAGEGTLVATANVLDTLAPADAAAALAQVLAHRPDVVGLQEWGRARRALLRVDDDYTWVSPAYGGNAVGVRSDRYRVLGWRLAPLGGVARADRGARPVPVLPPRVATTVRLHDRRLDHDVTVIDYHLVPGVQSRGAYRHDRPLLTARHRSEVRRLGALVRRELATGAVVHALGDSNFDGLELPGLVSAWEGRRDDPAGTLGSSRKIDDVHGPGPATEVVHRSMPALPRSRASTAPWASSMLITAACSSGQPNSARLAAQ